MFEIREKLCSFVPALVLGGLLAATGCIDNSGNKTYPRGDAAADMGATDDAPGDDVPGTGDAAPASDAPASDAPVGDTAPAADAPANTDVANDRTDSADTTDLDVRVDVSGGG